MTLHLIKLCVGADSVRDLEDWIKQKLKEKRKRGEKPEHIHTHAHGAEARGGAGRRRLALLGDPRRDRLPRSASSTIRPFRDKDGIGRCRPGARSEGASWSRRGRSAPSRAGAISRPRMRRAISTGPRRAPRRCRKTCAASCANSACCESRASVPFASAWRCRRRSRKVRGSKRPNDQARSRAVESREWKHDHRNQADVTKAVLSELRARARPALSRNHGRLHPPSARLRPRGEADRGGVPGRPSPISSRSANTTNENHNEARADGRLARLLDAGLPAQQRRQRPDRDRRQPARAVLAHAFAAHARTAARSCARRRRGRRCSSMPGFATPSGEPVEGAEVDVWHSSPEGFYENQDPAQADMNLRGKFITDADGHIASAASSRPAIRSRSTGRWAICCARRAATTCGRRTCISWSTSRASRR